MWNVVTMYEAANSKISDQTLPPHFTNHPYYKDNRNVENEPLLLRINPRVQDRGVTLYYKDKDRL